MKKVLCAVAVLLLVGLGGTAFAEGNSPMLNCGTQELGLSGSIDFDDPGGDAALDIEARYGYFILDNFELGPKVEYVMEEGGDYERFQLGIFTEYNFPVSTIAVPYIGVSLDYSYQEYDDYDWDEDAFIVTPAVGVKWFITDYFAIDTRLFYNWASEDIYVNDYELEDDNWGMSLGLRTYF